MPAQGNGVVQDGERSRLPPVMSCLEIAFRLGLATGAGLAIGLERELHHKAAGLRTHALVALGTAAIMIVAVQMDKSASRVIQGLVTGIGFIGAGTILHSEGRIEGVTTAASIWACTMIGIAAGAGYFVVLTVTLVLTVLVLGAGRIAERLLRTKM